MSDAQRKWHRLARVQYVLENIAANNATEISTRLNAHEEKCVVAASHSMKSTIGLVFADLHIRHAIRLIREESELREQLAVAQKEAHRQRMRTERLNERVAKAEAIDTRKSEERDLEQLVGRRVGE